MLSPDRFQVIQALFDVIAPQPAPSQAQLLEFVQWRTASREGYYPEYVAAVELLESYAQRRLGGSYVNLSL
jgi:hypothetical protein